MTNDEIMAMDEDALRLEVARVNGVKRIATAQTHDFRNGYGPKRLIDAETGRDIPDFSRDIAAAWGLVEEMKETATKHDRHDTRSGIVLRYEQHEPWGPGWVIEKTADEMGPVDVILGPTAPIAICRAWLAWKAGK